MRKTHTLGLTACLLAALAVCSAADKPNDLPWRAKFDEVYRLENGQLVKLVRPPYIPERTDFLRWRGVISEENVPHLAGWQAVFNFDAKRADYKSLSGGQGTLGTPILFAGMSGTDAEGDLDLLHTKLPGDWIVRKDADCEAMLAAIVRVLRDELKRDIRITKARVKKEVSIARGTYKFVPTTGPFDAEHVHVFTTSKFRVDTRSGGGTFKLGPLLTDTIAAAIGQKVIDETDSGGKEILVSLHQSSNEVDGDTTKRDALLNNLAQQTSLTFDLEERDVDVWRVTEEGATPKGL
jgi:hypothetical protein